MNQISQIPPKTKKMMGHFNTIEEVSQHKTAIANKLLAKIKNLDEFFTANGVRK